MLKCLNSKMYRIVYPCKYILCQNTFSLLYNQHFYGTPIFPKNVLNFYILSFLEVTKFCSGLLMINLMNDLFYARFLWGMYGIQIYEIIY